MSKVFKYTLDVTERQTIKMPPLARILKIGVQEGHVRIWASVHEDYPEGDRTFVVVGTGCTIPDDVKLSSYRGTVQVGSFVWHIFEIRND